MPNNNFLPIISGVGSIVSQGMANWANAEQNRLNREHEIYLMGLQNQYATQQANAADERTRALYYDLQSPNAMVNQLKNAGLSVSMMYGQGGMGGQMQAGAQGETPNAQNRGTIPMYNIMDAQAASLIADAQKKEAEIRNINQDTNKKESETAANWKEIPIKEKQLIIMDHSIQKTQTEIQKLNKEIETEIERKLQVMSETDKNKAEKEYKEALTAYTNSQKEIAEKLATAQEEEILAHARQLRASASKLEVEAATLRATMQYTIKEAVYSAALKEIELIYEPGRKDLEWSNAQAQIDKWLEEAYEKGLDNEMYKDIEKQFGKGVASAIKHGIDMLSIVFKNVTSVVTKKAPTTN